MSLPTLTPRLRLILGALFGLLLLFFLFRHLAPSPAPSLVDSSPPANSSTTDLFEPIYLRFSLPINLTDLTYTSTPPETWEPSLPEPTTLILSHPLAFSPSTQYTLSFFWQGSPIGALAFTTAASQGDPRLTQTLHQEILSDYPLAYSTPYETSALKVVYSAPLTLEITLKTRALTSEQAINTIRSWVTQQGGDSLAHQYVVTPPP